MSVRDDRLPPFAWLALASLERIRRDLPTGRQAPARNALLALAEAASRRRDGRHREGDTLRDLATLSGVSERRLRDHLRDLASVGLVRIEAALDTHGRPLPTVYVLVGPDDSSGYPDGPDESSGYPDTLAPNRPGLRAREEGQETETSMDSPGRASEDDLDLSLAEQVRGILQRGIDGLTTDEPVKRVGRGAVLEALRAHPLPRDEVLAVAIDAREITQSQNRAPNVVGLLAQRLNRRCAEIAASSSAVEQSVRSETVG